jgi:hypothetical protein
LLPDYGIGTRESIGSKPVQPESSTGRIFGPGSQNHIYDLPGKNKRRNQQGIVFIKAHSRRVEAPATGKNEGKDFSRHVILCIEKPFVLT